MKKTIAITMMAVGLACHASGLYIISGYEFRKSNIRYTMLTTNDNESVEITPYAVRLLSVNNPNSIFGVGEWSVKTEGKEFQYGNLSNIRQNNVDHGQPVGSKGTTNAWPTTYTYAKAGIRRVKVYDEKSNIYNLGFQNPYIHTLFVDFSSFRSTNNYANSYKLSIKDCPILESITIKMPANANAVELTDLYSLPSLKNLTIENPKAFDRIHSTTLDRCPLTNDLIFAGCTNVGAGAFYACTNVQYVALPNARSIGGNVFNCSLSYITMASVKLKRLQIGDCLESVGVNTFYKTINFDTVEFVTDAQDWVAAWNAHPVLPNWLGPATATEIEGQAILTPFSTKQEQYYSGNSYPKPTKLVLVRRSAIQQ